MYIQVITEVEEEITDRPFDLIILFNFQQVGVYVLWQEILYVIKTINLGIII